jgi:hypothetical protein
MLTSCQTGLRHTELYTHDCKVNESKNNFKTCCHLNDVIQSDIY